MDNNEVRATRCRYNRRFHVYRSRGPVGKKGATDPAGSKLLKVFCEGIDTQSNVVAAVSVGETAYLGMNGNPYKVTNRVLRFYITNEFDALVFNTGIVLQYTFI